MSRPVLAVFGGSFDPPHVGHALVPAYLQVRGLADRVLVVPVWSHALGKEVSDFETRLAWTRAAMTAYGPNVVVSDMEAQLAREGGSGFTLDLLRAVARQYPQHRVRLVVGSDIVATKETKRWHRWDIIEREFDPIVIPRAGYSESAPALPEISSSAVRASLEAGGGGGDGDADPFLAAAVPSAVLRLIGSPAEHVLVVGTGHLAIHGARWLRTRGRRVTQMNSRTLAQQESFRPAAIWILVRDDAIGEVAERLLCGGDYDPTVPVLHAAGSVPAHGVLADAARRGHPVGTLHPVFSARRDNPSPGLEGACFGIEGDAAAVSWARSLVGDDAVVSLDGLGGSQRAAYHAACALVANHLAVLLHEGTSVWTRLGIDPQRSELALGALMASAIDNLVVMGCPAGVSGPLARGDLRTVQSHLRSLESVSPEARSLYEELAKRLEALLASGSDSSAG